MPPVRTSCLVATVVGAVVLGSILLMLIIEGIRGFSPALFTQPTPGPGSISLDVENQDISQSSNWPVTEPGQLGGVGSGGVNVDYAFTGLDAQGRPVLTFTRG